MKSTWTAVEQYIVETVARTDPVLDAALASCAAEGLPSISVTANEGKLLQLLASARGARKILEIGTLGGYSTIWLARALPAGGRLITLEINQHHAEVARANLANAGLHDRVEVWVAPAAESLERLQSEGGEPFDLVFIDADKASSDRYFAAAHRLARVGALIIVDNVVRDGAIVDTSNTTADVEGVRRMNALIAREPGVSATALQTVGSKGYDGFLLAMVVGAPSSGNESRD